MRIATFSSVWGSSTGGIDVFNMDLVRSLSAVPSVEVCACLQIRSAALVEDSKKFGFRYVTASDELATPEVVDKLNPWNETQFRAICALLLREQFRPDYVLLHDIFCKEIITSIPNWMPDTKVVTLFHSAYGRSEKRKGKPDTELDRKVTYQAEMVAESDLAISVGSFSESYLRSISAEEHHARIKSMLPGLPAIKSSAKKVNNFNAISFGRLDPVSDTLKQIRVAATAWVNAVESNTISALETSDITFYAVGARGDSSVLSEEKGRLNTWRAHILEIPFQDVAGFDNSSIRLRMESCAFAVLNSWYENFGLTYLEACTFGIPTIMSESSGFYHDLVKVLGRDDVERLVISVKVEGVEENRLIDEIKLKLIANAQAYDESFDKASQLRTLLLEKWPSWKDVANGLVKDLNSAGDRRAQALVAGEGPIDDDDDGESAAQEDTRWPETLRDLRDWCWENNAPYYQSMRSTHDYGKSDKFGLTALQKSFWDSRAELVDHPFRDLVLSGGTSSGKTTLAECLFGRSRDHEFMRSRILYVAPTKALAQERAEDWKSKFPPPQVREPEFSPVIVSTGDDNASDGALTRGDFNIAATVYEKANIILTAGQDLLSQLNLVIIDEFHMLDDLHRGSVVECLLAKIKIEKVRRLDSVNRDNPLRVIVITTEDPGESIGRFLSFDDDGTGDEVEPLILVDSGRVRKVAHSVVLPGRNQNSTPAAFKIREFGEDDDLFIEDSDVSEIAQRLQTFQSHLSLIEGGFGYDEKRKRTQYQMEFCIDWIRKNPRGGRLLIFMSSKFDILEFARMLKNELTRRPVYDLGDSPEVVSLNEAGSNVFLDALEGVESTDFVQDIERCAKSGVFLHNADVPRNIRTAFESYLGQMLPRNSRSEFVIATETLSFGVNLQISDVAIFSVMFPENERVPTGRLVWNLLSRCDFVNMCGRAGRLNQGGQSRVPQVYWYIDPLNKEERSFESAARNFYGERKSVTSSLLFRSDARALSELKTQSERAKFLSDSLGDALEATSTSKLTKEEGEIGDLARDHPDRFSAVEKLSYPFTRSVLDCVRFLGGTSTKVGSLGKPGCSDREAVSGFFFETLYYQQLAYEPEVSGSSTSMASDVPSSPASTDRASKRKRVLAQAVKNVMESASLPQYQLLRKLPSGAYQITALGSASIDTGTEIRTVVNLRQALLALSGAWRNYFSAELPFELAVLPAFFQPEVYRQYIARLPEFKLAMDWNPAENRDDLIGRITERFEAEGILSNDDVFKIRAVIADFVAWTVANQPIVSDPIRFDELRYDACLRLFVAFLAWTSGASLRGVISEIQSIYPSSGQKTESSVFNFEAFAENLTWKITFLVSLLRASDEQILPEKSAFDAVRFVHRSRFGCVEKAVPILYRNKSTVPPLNRVQAHSIIAKGHNAATIALGQLDGVSGFDAKKERQVRNHVRKFVSESFQELSRQFSYLASGSGLGKVNEDISKEYWSFSAKQIASLLESGTAIEFSWATGSGLTGEDHRELLHQEHEGSQLLLETSAGGLSMTTFQSTFASEDSDQIELTKKREIGVRFSFGTHLDAMGTARTADERGFVIDFPWAMGIDDGSGDDTRLSPAAFGILLSLCSREFVADVDRYLAAILEHSGGRCIGSRDLYMLSEPHLKKGGFPEGLYEAWAKYIEVGEALG